MIRCTVGVLAHNEAHNIQQVLHALLAQELKEVAIAEIVVIASGCTDNTVELARHIATSHPVVRVEVEEKRTGKAAALKHLITMARGEVIVLVGADTLPEPTAVEHLVAPFADATVGMTGARVIPLNAPTKWLGFAVQMLWHVHHQLALRHPKLGELVAFRNVVGDFPANTSTDEAAIEALIVAKGLRLVYVPKAVVFNRGPERASEFLLQRRRIFAGHMSIAMRYRYFTSSMRMRYMVPLVVEAIRCYPRFFLWTFAAIAVESWARLLGTMDALRKRETPVWQMADSTKAVVAAGPSEPLTLIAVSWSPGSLNAMAFLRDLRRHSEPAGSVFWWDASQGEILLFVGGQSPLAWFEERIRPVTREHVRPHPVYSNSAKNLSVSWVKPTLKERDLVSCRMVKFSFPAVN